MIRVRGDRVRVRGDDDDVIVDTIDGFILSLLFDYHHQHYYHYHYFQLPLLLLLLLTCQDA